MAISRDVTGKNASISSPLTWTHVMSATSGGFVMVNVGYQGNSPVPTGLACTFGGVSMTLADTISQGSNGVIQWAFYIFSPLTGSQTVSVTWSGANPSAVSGVSGSWIGVSSAGFDVGEASAHGNGGGTGTISLTTVSDNCWVLFLDTVFNNPSQTGGTNTVYRDNSNGTYIFDTNTVVHPAGSLTQSTTWIGAAQDWIAMQFAIQPLVTKTFSSSDSITCTEHMSFYQRITFLISNTIGSTDSWTSMFAKVISAFDSISTIERAATLTQRWMHAVKHTATWGKASKSTAAVWSKTSKHVTIWTKRNKS